MFLNKWFDGNSGKLIKVTEMGRYFFNWKSKDFFFFFQNGEIQPMSVKVGEKVLLPEYGGTKIVLEDKVGFQTLSANQNSSWNTSDKYCGYFMLLAAFKEGSSWIHLLVALLLVLLSLHKRKQPWVPLSWPLLGGQNVPCVKHVLEGIKKDFEIPGDILAFGRESLQNCFVTRLHFPLLKIVTW